MSAPFRMRVALFDRLGERDVIAALRQLSDRDRSHVVRTCVVAGFRFLNGDVPIPETKPAQVEPIPKQKQQKQQMLKQQEPKPEPKPQPPMKDFLS